MQEQVEDKTVNLAVSTTKLTGHVMWSAFKAFRNYVKEKMAENADDKITGRQSLKELIGQNQGVSALEIGDGTFKDFLKCADKVGVDYAITVDKSVNITSHIRRLRVKIEDNPAKPEYIQTVRGIGYRMPCIDSVNR